MAEPVYEMLWDCRYCGAKKLLGLSHRHCPNCGAKQEPNARYFPAEADKVAVHDHEFVGADLICRYCGAACSRKAHNCGQCGAPLSEGTPVQPLAAPAAPPLTMPSAKTPGGPRSRSPWRVALPAGIVALIAGVVVLMVCKNEEKFVVEAHHWQRTIQVERFGLAQKSAWCDALPAAARDVSRHRERRGSRQVPDGETCATKRHDRGDGTFVEAQECVAKHKDEPVYDDKCDFTVEQWSSARQAMLEGMAPAQPPRWPDLALARAGCGQPGCEREGRHDETYTLVLRDAKGEHYRCSLAEAGWSRFTDGKSYAGKLRALVGSLDCGSLSP